MTAPQSCQPEAATPYQHVCSDVDCCYQGQPSFRGCGCYKTREQMMAARIEELTKLLGSSAAVAQDAVNVLVAGSNPASPATSSMPLEDQK